MLKDNFLKKKIKPWFLCVKYFINAGYEGTVKNLQQIQTHTHICRLAGRLKWIPKIGQCAQGNNYLQLQDTFALL